MSQKSGKPKLSKTDAQGRMGMAKPRTKPRRKQLCRMLNELAKNKLLTRDKYKPEEIVHPRRGSYLKILNEDFDRRWASLAKVLNEMGPKKSVEEWIDFWKSCEPYARRKLELYKERKIVGLTDLVTFILHILGVDYELRGDREAIAFRKKSLKSAKESAHESVNDVTLQQEPSTSRSRPPFHRNGKVTVMQRAGASSAAGNLGGNVGSSLAQDSLDRCLEDLKQSQERIAAEVRNQELIRQRLAGLRYLSEAPPLQLHESQISHSTSLATSYDPDYSEVDTDGDDTDWPSDDDCNDNNRTIF